MSIDWNIVQTAIPLLARGTVVTLQISLVAGVLACIIGFTLGLAALSHVRAAALGRSRPMSISCAARRC